MLSECFLFMVIFHTDSQVFSASRHLGVETEKCKFSKMYILSISWINKKRLSFTVDPNVATIAQTVLVHNSHEHALKYVNV